MDRVDIKNTIKKRKLNSDTNDTNAPPTLTKFFLKFEKPKANPKNTFP